MNWSAIGRWPGGNGMDQSSMLWCALLWCDSKQQCWHNVCITWFTSTRSAWRKISAAWTDFPLAPFFHFQRFMTFWSNIFLQDCIQPFGHKMLSWVRLRGRLRGINTHSVLPPPTRLLDGTNLLLGEQGHQSVSSLSRAISQKIGGLGKRTGDPSISGSTP